MLPISERERALIQRVGPVVARRFDELASQWRAAWGETAGRPPSIDLPAITLSAVRDGIDEALARQRRLADRIVAAGLPLDEVVSAVLLWGEILLRRLVRDAVEDVFTGAAALKRFNHNLVILVAQGYWATVARERDEIRKSFEEADRLKTDLISMVSHDLKTPLTTIQGCAASMLEVEEVDAEQRRRFLEMILANAERLSRLISQIVDLSTIEARALEMTFEDLDLRAVAGKLLEGILPSAPVRVVFPPRLPPVRADRDATERILLNLIDNAVRFSPAGETVRVGAEAVDGAVELRVTDAGPGVPEGRRPGLFSKFYQVDPSASGRRAGSGLGLAIVRALAEAMGGSVGYRPNQPAGSVFWVRLPVTDGGEP